MSETLLQTKLFIPRLRPSLVTRSRLFEQLNHGSDQGSNLTLVCAPAGFGKTTLIAEWLTSQSAFRHPKLCWLSLDKYDHDPNRFWQYVLAALQTAVPYIGAATQQFLSSVPLPPPPALLTGLLNDLAELTHPIILVLDDYHVITGQPIHEGLKFLLDHAPSQLHLVLITRADPPLSLARLHARGQLNEIRVADLRFTSEETAVFLREVMGLPLSADDITALEARTEGWIAGLQLTAISLQGRADTSDFIKGFTESHHYILEYLAEEVLQQQPLSLPPSAEHQALRGELATYLATIAFFHEEPAHVIQAAEEALAYLPPDELTSRARATSALGLGVSLAGDTRRAMRLFYETAEMARLAGNPFFLAHALEIVADGQLHSGQLRAAAATCQEIIDLGTNERSLPLPFAGNGHIKLASIYVEWHQLTKAVEQMAAGVALNRQGGIGYNLLQDHCTQVRLRKALGDEEGALAALRQGEAVFRQNQSRIMAVQLAACEVQFWLDAGDVATAESWAEGQPLISKPFPLAELPIIGQEVQQVSLARVRLAQERPADVLAIFDPLYNQARAAGRIARAIEIGLLAALAYQMKRETAVALDTLRQVLALTEPEGYVQIFVESGEPMRRLLCKIPPAAQTGYLHKLIRAFPDSLQLASTALIEPLSPRELEVLRLIAAGLSNKEIAVELTVSLNTVKKHTNHIYGKLEVNGRTQAIACARELNLI